MADTGAELAATHNREIPTPSRHLSPAQFAGATSIGAWSTDRTGGLGGTSMSEAAGQRAGHEGTSMVESRGLPAQQPWRAAD